MIKDKTRVIGILGTAKNTGKTTTLNFLLEWLNRKGINVGLTSIGYDGEDIDNITGLPKPRIFIQKENIIATAEQCLLSIEDKKVIEIMEKTTVYNALGEIILGKGLRKGLVVLAGPNKGRDLQIIIHQLKQQKVEIILVDGALNRMLPMMYCDALILATGASRNTDIDLLVDETESITRTFNLPLRQKAKISNQEILSYQKKIMVLKQDRPIKKLDDYSLLSERTLNNLIDVINDEDFEEIYIPGIIQDLILKKIAKDYSKLFQGKTILINNPIFLLVGSRDIRHLKDLIEKISNSGISIKTLYNLPILAVTINPFYPKYSRLRKDSYEMGWIDGYQLYYKMKSKIFIPVINIMGEESNKLLTVIKRFLKNTID